MFSARMMVEKPDEVTVTLKLTGSVKEWTELRDQLADRWPSSDLSRAITDCLGQVRKIVYPADAA